MMSHHKQLVHSRHEYWQQHYLTSHFSPSQKSCSPGGGIFCICSSSSMRSPKTVSLFYASIGMFMPQSWTRQQRCKRCTGIARRDTSAAAVTPCLSAILPCRGPSGHRDSRVAAAKLRLTSWGANEQRAGVQVCMHADAIWANSAVHTVMSARLGLCRTYWPDQRSVLVCN